MARIRSVKPELRTSLTAAEWPREVRYFWVLLWGYLDDHGYGQDEPRIIKGDCFPMDDDLSSSDIDKWLDLIAGSGSVCRYAGPDGRRYLHAPKWPEHQRPQHPALPRYPACVSSHEVLMNGSHETHMSLSGDSPETNPSANGVNAVLAGQPRDGDSHEAYGGSHESLTPEGERESSRGGGVAERAREARSSRGATILGNAILDEHRRMVKPTLPREVTRVLGEVIEDLLDDREISPDEIRAALVKLRSNPKLGPRVLPSLVNEVRQLTANPDLATRPSPRLAAEQAHRTRALERAQAREDK